MKEIFEFIMLTCFGLSWPISVWKSIKSKSTQGKSVVFIIAIIIGGIVAGIFGFLIGIPVLRLNGDYLAIVTLAFGEIIKNVINVLYIGRDANGFHISASSANNLGLDAATGEIIVNGPQGITGTPKDSTFLIAMIVLIICLVVVLNLIHLE